jgi:hypothetical protein
MNQALMAVTITIVQNKPEQNFDPPGAGIEDHVWKRKKVQNEFRLATNAQSKLRISTNAEANKDLIEPTYRSLSRLRYGRENWM